MNKHYEEKPVLMLFLKAPVAGLVKTRLAADVGNDVALAAYRQLAEHQLKQTPDGWYQEIHYAPADAQSQFRNWLGQDHHYIPQYEGHLGERLSQGFKRAFQNGAKTAFVIGGDCPALNRQRLLEAQDALNRADAVLGPATDGGYYLLGLKRHELTLFQNINWSTDSVAEATRQRLRSADLRFTELPVETDVDDLATWQAASARYFGKPACTAS